MSKEEIKNEKPNAILGIVNGIIDFNKEIKQTRFRVKDFKTRSDA